MLGSSAPGPVAREAGSALLTLQQTALQEDQENINPEKAAAAQQPRTRAGLAVLKAGNSRGPALQQRPKTRRVAPLKDLPINDEHVTVPPWKANSKQPAFTIHVDEAEEETQRGQLNLKNQKVKMSWLLIQLLLYLDQENHWYLLITQWMVVLSHHILWTCQLYWKMKSQ